MISRLHCFPLVRSYYLKAHDVICQHAREKKHQSTLVNFKKAHVPGNVFYCSIRRSRSLFVYVRNTRSDKRYWGRKNYDVLKCGHVDLSTIQPIHFVQYITWDLLSPASKSFFRDISIFKTLQRVSNIADRAGHRLTKRYKCCKPRGLTVDKPRTASLSYFWKCKSQWQHFT